MAESAIVRIPHIPIAMIDMMRTYSVNLVMYWFLLYYVLLYNKGPMVIYSQKRNEPKNNLGNRFGIIDGYD